MKLFFILFSTILFCCSRLTLSTKQQEIVAEDEEPEIIAEDEPLNVNELDKDIDVEELHANNNVYSDSDDELSRAKWAPSTSRASAAGGPGPATTKSPKRRWLQTKMKFQVLYGMRRKHDYVRNLYKKRKYSMPKIWGGIVKSVDAPIEDSDDDDKDSADHYDDFDDAEADTDTDAADVAAASDTSFEEDTAKYPKERKTQLKEIEEQAKRDEEERLMSEEQQELLIAQQKEQSRKEGTASKSSKKSTKKGIVSKSDSSKKGVKEEGTVSKSDNSKQSTKANRTRKRRQAETQSKPRKVLYSKKHSLMTVIMRYVKLKLRDMSEQYGKFIGQVKTWPKNVETVIDAFTADDVMYVEYEKLTHDWPKKKTAGLDWPADKKKELNWPEDRKPTLKEYHLDKLRGMANKYNEFNEVVLNWPDKGCFITFPLETNILNKVFLFDFALTHKTEDLKVELETGLFTHAQIHKDTPNDFFKDKEWSQKLNDDNERAEDEDEDDDDDDSDEDDDDDDDEDEAKMAGTAALQAILHGRAGFGPSAKLDITQLPKIVEKKKKDKWQLAKRIITKLFRFFKWTLRAVCKLRKLLNKKAYNQLKDDLKAIEEDDQLKQIYESLAKSKKEFETEMAQREKVAKKEMDEEENTDNQQKQNTEQQQPKEGVNHSAHEQMTEKDRLPHPFDFLAGVRYDFHVKPADEKFDQLYPAKYEELMEFYENPKEFYKKKRLDADSIYVMLKFLEPNPHLAKLYRKQYYLIHEFFNDPVAFYQHGNKFDRKMSKAYARILKGYLKKLKENEEKNPLPKILQGDLATEQAMRCFGFPSIPNNVFGSTEQLHDEGLKAISKVLKDNELVIKARLIKKKVCPNYNNATTHFASLSTFLHHPVEHYDKLNFEVFKIFREVVEVNNEKDSNEELAHLSTEEYQDLLDFLKSPNEFLRKIENPNYITTIITVQEEVKTKHKMFKNIDQKKKVQLTYFLDWVTKVQNVVKNKREEFDNMVNEQDLDLSFLIWAQNEQHLVELYKGPLDHSIFSNYRQSLPAKRKLSIWERIKRFFKGSKFEFVFSEFKSEHQFDQLMRFLKHPDRFYQPLQLNDKELKIYRKILNNIVANKKQKSEFSHLGQKEYAELMTLAQNPASLYAPSEKDNKFVPAPGPKYEGTFSAYTKPLAKNASCAKVKQFIELALFSKQDQQQMSTDLRGRLGAQILSSVLNTKYFEKKMIIALVASLVGSAGIAAGLDIGLWHLVLLAIGSSHPVIGIIVSIILDSLTPLFAETFDSFVIKRTLGTIDGKSLLPKSWKQFKEDFKESVISGAIASFGAIPNNIVMTLLPGAKYLKAHQFGQLVGVFALNAFTNQIAASTSAAMVPIQVEKWHKYRSAAFYKLLVEGFFASPKESKLLYGTVNPKTIAGYCRINAMDAMQIDAVTSMAYNSMGIGAVISFFFGYTAIYIPVMLGAIPDQWQRIVSIMFNTPTEILSLGAGLLSANQLGANWSQRWISTATHKDQQMVKLIFQKAIAQLQDPKREFKEIEYEDVYKIYHSRFQLTYKMGKGIVNLMIGIKNGIANLCKRKPPTIDQLDEQFIDKEIMVQNWKPGVVYLVQFPRTELAPSLSPAAIKLETWLRMEKIPTYTVSDGVLFRALFSYDQKVPFVEYNGQKVFGNTDEIIDTLKFLFNRKRPFGDFVPAIMEDKPNNELINEKLHSILLRDRIENLKLPESEAHLLRSKDFQHFVIPTLLKEAKRNWYKILPLPMPFWREYFEKGTVEQGKASWNGLNLSTKKWREFLNEVDKTHIPKALKEFRELLLNQLRGWTLAEDSHLEHIIPQIEQQLHHDGDNNLCISKKQLSVLDASLFGILAQFSYKGTINNANVNDDVMSLLNDNNSRLGQYFAQMKAIFMGKSPELNKNSWPINAEWKFDHNEKKYNGPFMLRFDTMKLKYSDIIRFTDEQRKSFWPLLVVNSSISTFRLDDAIFVETNFLALYPKVVTFIVHYLLEFFDSEEYVKMMAHMTTIVELKQNCIKFELEEFKKEIVGITEAMTKQRGTEENTKKPICRALIHMVAAYLCQGTIEENDCTKVHNQVAKKHLYDIFKKDRTKFSELSIAVQKFVYYMMTEVTVEYQTKESLKMFAAALLDKNEEQSIKYEANQLLKILDHLAEFGDKKLDLSRNQIAQNAEEHDKQLSTWVLRKYIVIEMQNLVNALNDDAKLTRDKVQFKDIELAHNHWLNLNVVIKTYKDILGEDNYIDNAQMLSGYNKIVDHKKKHIFKKLGNKTKDLFEFSIIYNEKKYHEMLSYGLGQVRKMYELRKSQLTKDEAIKESEFKEQYEEKRKKLIDDLSTYKAKMIMDKIEEMEENVDVLSDVIFTLKGQSIKSEAKKIRADIKRLSKKHIIQKKDELKKLSKKKLEKTRSEIEALVCKEFLLNEVLNLTTFLDDKKFEKDSYPFSDFEDAYLSGEVLKWLFNKMKKSGFKFDQSEIDKGFAYVKDRRSKHHWHNMRASMFDWHAWRLAKEKKFLKVLAWRIGQVVKLYMLRKANISGINPNSNSGKEEQFKELTNTCSMEAEQSKGLDDIIGTSKFKKWNTFFTKTIIWEKKHEELGKQFSTKIEELKEQMEISANNIINEATGKDTDGDSEDADVEMPLEQSISELAKQDA